MSRWVNGRRQRHVAGTDTALISDLSLAEIEEHKNRLEFVSAEPFATTKPQPPLAPMPIPSKEPVVVSAAAQSLKAEEGEEEEGEIDWGEVLSGNVASIKDYIVNTLDDAALVSSLMEAESAGKSRSTVLRACAERIAALTEAEEEEEE